MYMAGICDKIPLTKESAMFYRIEYNQYTAKIDIVLISTGKVAASYENQDYALRQLSVMNYHAKTRGYANPGTL
jgi:hypothetical protein